MKNKLAIISFILSIVWLVFIIPTKYSLLGIYLVPTILIIALITSICSLIKIKKEKLDGKVRSWIALIISGLILLILLILILNNLFYCGRIFCYIW